MREQLSLSLGKPKTTWGGRRAGAGRPKTKVPPPNVPHRARGAHARSYPVHVTMRAVAGAPNLREMRVFVALEASLRRVAIAVERGRSEFRVAAFSIQHDHVHLVVEARDRESLGRGIHGLAVRFARAVNRAARRRGKVWEGRHHRRALRSPREVRSALVYVLQNFKKHETTLVARPTQLAIDPLSSAIWFEGWSSRVDAIMLDVMTPPALDVGPTVARPRTWLLRQGWLRHGEIDPAESPQSPPRARVRS